LSDAGYTLAETLAALVVIGLAVGSMAAGMQLFGRVQARNEAAVRNDRALRAISFSLQERLGREGPFRSCETNRLSGGGDGFAYACGGVRPCKVEVEGGADRFALKLGDQAGQTIRLEVRRGGHPQFRYLSDRGESDRWPPDSPQTQTLRGVVLTVDDASPAMPPIVAHIWAEQPARCTFDAITQDCR